MKVPIVGLVAILFAFLLAASSFVVFAQTSTPQFGGGTIQGTVYGFDMWGYLRPISWASVIASNGQNKFVASSGGDGYYMMYVPAGMYNVTVSQSGYIASSFSVAVSDGSTNSINFDLEQSHVPVPEYPPGAFVLVLFVALASVLVVQRTMLRRSRVK